MLVSLSSSWVPVDMTSICTESRLAILDSPQLRYQNSHGGIQARVDSMFLWVTLVLLAGQLERFLSWSLDSDFTVLATLGITYYTQEVGAVPG